jgi:uncharacterized repeat protein (TIGR03803 family)
MLIVTPASAQVVLHNFMGPPPDDGKAPNGSLVPFGSDFYGMTSEGGSMGFGTIFKIGNNGTGYTPLHVFTGGSNDGRNPLGTLVQSGGFFYGMTLAAGSGGVGTVFRTNSDGTGFTILHSFQGGANDGDGPLGSPIVSGGVIYGMTQQGGTANLGVVYRMNADGTGFQVVHSFTGTATDGQTPSYSALVVSGGSVYGMTPGGGTAGLGVIFKMNADGSGFSVLHSFTATGGDGYGPTSGLTLVGNTLYGMTFQGGGHGVGTIFKIGTDGTGYAHLHEFAGGPNDGANPTAEDLTLVGNTLYGETSRGGTSALGVLLHVNLDGSNYGVDHSFGGAPNDGSGPAGAPLEFNGNLYGMTATGGTANDGIIYSFTPIPEPSSMALLTAVAAAAAVARRVRRKRANSPSDR